MPTNSIYLSNNADVWYNVDTDIGGFQWTIDGTTATDASGGDAAAAGFTVSVGGSTVLGFSFTGGSVPAGCGTLTTLALAGEATGLSYIVFSDPVGTAFDVSYYDDSGDDVAFMEQRVRDINNAISSTLCSKTEEDTNEIKVPTLNNSHHDLQEAKKKLLNPPQIEQLRHYLDNAGQFMESDANMIIQSRDVCDLARVRDLELEPTLLREIGEKTMPENVYDMVAQGHISHVKSAALEEGAEE